MAPIVSNTVLLGVNAQRKQVYCRGQKYLHFLEENDIPHEPGTVVEGCKTVHFSGRVFYVPTVTFFNFFKSHEEEMKIAHDGPSIPVERKDATVAKTVRPKGLSIFSDIAVPPFMTP
jgi:hypothetical protein